jgi:hypothetical protein
MGDHATNVETGHYRERRAATLGSFNHDLRQVLLLR